MKRILLASASIAACMLGAGLGAGYALAETELEEIVVKTNFNTTNFVNPDIRVMDGQVLLTAPANVTVIDRERFNLDTVNYTDTRYELMTRVPGMTNVRNLRIPCGWCDYTVNLQNGMATQPLGGGSFNFNEANNFDIERIEIIKGPASALYPSHAFGGVINIITKKPPKRPTLRIFSDTGSWGRYRMGTDFGFSIENASILGYDVGLLGFKANASHYELDGWREWRGEKKDTASFRMTWEPTGATSMEIGGTYTKRYDENPGSLEIYVSSGEDWKDYWGAAPDPSVSKSKTGYLDAQLKHQLESGGEFKLAYGYVHEESSSVWSDSIEDRHDLKPRYTGEFDFLSSKLISGVDLSYSERERIDSSDTLAYIASPYAQYEFSPFAGTAGLDGLKFTLGGRYEYTKYDYTDYENAGNNGKISFSKATPHAGVTWKWNEKNSIWFSYSQGYSVPSASRIWPDPISYWPTRSKNLANPDLKPEQAENFEIGARGSLLEDKIVYDVSWHRTTIDDFIQKEFLGVDGGFEVYQYQNIGRVRTQGIEAQLGLWPVKWAGIEASYTYALNKYLKYTDWYGNVLDGKYMYASPKHHLNTRFILKPLEGTKVELEWDHISKYYTDSANTDTYKRPDLLHLSASYTWNGFVTFWGQIRNLTNEKYADRVSYRYDDDVSDYYRSYRMGLPRSYAVGISIKAQF